MRIGIIAPPWTPIPPVLYGGIEVIVDQLATAFQSAGHDVLLFTTGDSTSAVPRRHHLDKAEGARIGHTAPETRHVLAAYDAMVEWGADIVHDHTLAGPIHAASAGASLPFPVITTMHNQFDHELSDLYRRIASRVPIIAISHAQRRPVPDLPIARVIHHGLRAADFPVGDGHGDPERDYCLFLGRMSPDKGPHRAMEAAYKAGVRLVMCAKMRDPWEFDYFDEYVRPYLNADIQYLGEVPHGRKLELLAGARALLFPIRWNEPFGMVVLEAFACGTPVLAFPEGAIPEIVEHGRTGYLCNDVADLAESIGHIDLLDRSACRAAVEGYYSADRMAREHLELFASVLA
ncbi:MAG TPA: glycosyltransferase family 4 protein [Acidimicrobiales bacterium]|nr:glycosyltransferase family 4 protein [Acidimicrobiales bacterium]